MTVLTCPVCQGDMREIVRGGVTIDMCTKCRGVWLDRGELEKLAMEISSDPMAQSTHPDSPNVAAPSGGFWRQHQPPPQEAVPQQRRQPDGYRDWRDDDDDDRYQGDRGHGTPKKSKLRGLMDFFD